MQIITEQEFYDNIAKTTFVCPFTKLIKAYLVEDRLYVKFNRLHLRIEGVKPEPCEATTIHYSEEKEKRIEELVVQNYTFRLFIDKEPYSAKIVIDTDTEIYASAI